MNRKRLGGALLLSLLLLAASSVFAEETIITNTKVITVTPTIETSAYAAGDVIGEEMTFSGAGRSHIKSGMVQQVTMTDLGAEGKNVELILFDTQLANSTITDNSAFDPADADLLTAVCRITISSHSSFNDNGMSSAGNIACPVENATTLYGILVAREAVT